MKSPSASRRLRFLIVEDDPGTVELLAYRLMRAFPGADIQTADNVADAEKLLGQSLELNGRFDAVILDFLLPPDKTRSPIPDHSLALSIRDDSPETFIVHITSHEHDSRFKPYLQYRHAPAEKGRCFVAKEGNWMDTVAERLARDLPIYRIRRKFDELFVREADGRLHRAGPVSANGLHRNRSHALTVATLCDDASRHWTALPTALQNDLAEAFGHSQDSRGLHFVGPRIEPTEDEVDL